MWECQHWVNLNMGDDHTNDDFEIKKILIFVASGARDEAQTSCSTIISIKKLRNSLNRKAV